MLRVRCLVARDNLEEAFAVSRQQLEEDIQLGKRGDILESAI